MSEERFLASDMGQSLSKLMEKIYTTITIDEVDHRVERISTDTFKWGNFTGTFPEVAERIRKARVDLKNSIKKP